MEPQNLPDETSEERVKVCRTLNKDDIMLLETFPEEVWLHILDKIWDPATLFHLSKAALFWRRLLYSRRGEYLFPQVLKVLAAENYFNKKSRDYALPWRCVRKSWKRAVNTILEKCHDPDSQTFPAHNFDTKAPFGCYSCFPIYCQQNFLRRQKGICEALEKSDSPSSIFPTRCLSIHENYYRCSPIGATAGSGGMQDASQLHFPDKINILEIVGHHFWHASFYVECDYTNGQNFYNTICDHVTLIPNLKSISVSYDKRHNKCPPHFGPNKTFSTLGNLSVLKFSDVDCKCSKRVLAAILQANPQIKVLLLTSSNWGAFELPALTCLHTLSLCFRGTKKEFHLPQLPRLRMLRLECPTDESLHWSVLLNKLKIYKETLGELCLWMSCACPSDSMKNRLFSTVFGQKKVFRTNMKPIDLPNVKVLELSMSSCCSLDFILGLQYLECIRLRTWQDTEFVTSKRLTLHPAAKYNVLQTRGLCTGQKSNIWQLIPSLKVLEIRREYSTEGLSRTYKPENVPQQIDKNV